MSWESSSEEKIFSGGGQWPNTGFQCEPCDQWVTSTVPTRPTFKQEDPSVSYRKARGDTLPDLSRRCLWPFCAPASWWKHRNDRKTEVGAVCSKSTHRAKPP